MFVCDFCKREFSNKGGLSTHQPYCKSNPDRVQRKKSPLAHAKKGSVSHRKGKHLPQSHKDKIGVSSLGRTHSVETRKLLSNLAKQQNFGGVTVGGGRGKKGRYKGIWCDSSWELAFLIYCIDNNIPIERNTIPLFYTYENKLKKYYPDFIVNGDLTEIKGYRTLQWEEKIKNNPQVKVLYLPEMTPILNYVNQKYGKDFIRLYE